MTFLFYLETHWNLLTLLHFLLRQEVDEVLVTLQVLVTGGL